MPGTSRRGGEDVIPSVKERDSFQSQPKKNLKIYKRP